MNIVKTNPKVFFPSIIEELFKPDFFGGTQDFTTKVPAVNVKETQVGFSIELLVPGFKKEDFKIEIDNDLLIVSSEVTKDLEEKIETDKYTRREFSFSSFKRSFSLPETVNKEAINATYVDGILYLTLPKREETLPEPKRFIKIG